MSLKATCGVIIGLIAVFIWASTPAVHRDYGPSKKYRDIHLLRQLMVACHYYADERGGEFPPDLEALITNQTLDESDRELLYHDPSDLNTPKWTYFPGLNKDSPGETILIKSSAPITLKKRKFLIFSETYKTNKIVEARVNGSVRLVRLPEEQLSKDKAE